MNPNYLIKIVFGRSKSLKLLPLGDKDVQRWFHTFTHTLNGGPYRPFVCFFFTAPVFSQFWLNFRQILWFVFTFIYTIVFGEAVRVGTMSYFHMELGPNQRILVTRVLCIFYDAKTGYLPMDLIEIRLHWHKRCTISKKSKPI